MLILGIMAIILVLTICVSTVVYFLGKYHKAKDEAEKQRLRAVSAENSARVAAGQRPIPGSGVDASELAARYRTPSPPEPPPNRTESGRVSTRPRTRPRSRQSMESSFTDLFSSMSEQMTQVFTGVSQAVSVVSEQATLSVAIARDAQSLLNLGFVQENIQLDQSRRSNLQHLSLIPGVSSRTVTALQRLETSNRIAEHLNWGRLVIQFMRMIDSGGITFENENKAPEPTTAKEPEPEKLPPTRFEREDVI